MPTFDLNIKYKKNSDLVISPKQLRDIYLFGIPIKDQNGVSLDDETLRFYIKAAQDEVEEFLNVKLKRQIIEETKEFSGVDFVRWGYIKATYLVECALSLEGFFNTTKQVTYPVTWLSTKQTNDGKNFHRNIYIVPSGDATTFSEALTISGIVPELGYLGWTNIPNYWKLRYATGFEEVPNDILNAIGKMASMNIFAIAGDLIIGAGIASTSLSIDGLSQAISTTQSAENAGYSARIKQYQAELKLALPKLRDYYRGFSWGVA